MLAIIGLSMTCVCRQIRSLGEGRTARAVDAEDDRFDGFILRGVLQGFDDRRRSHRRPAKQAALALAAHDGADGVDDGNLWGAVAAAAASFAHHRLKELHHAHRAAEVRVDLLLRVILHIDELVGFVFLFERFAKLIRIGHPIDETGPF
jgi:hypothetical protein